MMEWMNWLDKVQISTERNYRVSPLRQYLWGCGKLLPFANIFSSLFFLGARKGHICLPHWVEVRLCEPCNVSKVTYVPSRWWLVPDHWCPFSPAAAAVESWVEAAARIAQPTGGPCSGELPGCKSDLYEQEIYPCCQKPMHGYSPPWLRRCIYRPPNMLFFSVNLPDPQQEADSVSSPLGSGGRSDSWYKMRKSQEGVLEHCSVGTLALYLLLLRIQPASWTESSHVSALVKSPSSSESSQAGTTHVSEEASRWFQPLSHLSAPQLSPQTLHGRYKTSPLCCI